MLADLKEIKRPNHRNVLNIIRMKKEISGAEMARLSNLQPSTIVYILRDLKKRGLIEISRIGTSTGVGGKPPTLWKLVAKKGYIIGLEVLPHGIRLSIVDFASNIVYQQTFQDLPIKGNPDFILIIEDIVHNVLSRLNLLDDKIIGVGAALPGLIDCKNGMLIFSEPLALKKIPILPLLEKALHKTVIVTNDANAGALGIKWFNQEIGMQYQNIIYLTINEEIRGMGAGLIIEQQLYAGSTGTAGEIAAAFPPIEFLFQNGEKKYGKRTHAQYHPPIDELPGLSKIVEFTKGGCPVSNYVIQKVCDFLAREIFRIMIFINPDLIVVGGDITEIEFLFNDYVIPLIKKRMRSVYPDGVEMPKILYSPFGTYSVSVGATALVMREIFWETNIPSCYN
jgi:predicted NBD/HSP70 family sugar kinase